jgi:ATP-dependent Clp protease ATP-binding subunit ClpC
MLSARRRTKLTQTLKIAPVVGELLLAAQHEAAALRHDSIGTEHMLLALLGRTDETASTLRGLGLELGAVRDEVRRLVGNGPAQEDALERASRLRGSCAGAAFGVAPQLKQVLERARRDATRRNAPLRAADVAVGLAQQQDSVAARIFEAHAISPQTLRGALEAKLPKAVE